MSATSSLRWVVLATVALLAATQSAPAHAYLDPGTGSLVLQIVIGTLAAVGTTLSLYWQRLRAFFASRFGSRR
jgi:Zn-dependent protease with chaperone function